MTASQPIQGSMLPNLERAQREEIFERSNVIDNGLLRDGIDQG